MPPVLVPLVEGHSEVEAIPLLLRRILSDSEREAVIARPVRFKRGRLMQQGEVERLVQIAVRDRASAGGLLLVADADDDCPARLAPLLQARAEAEAGLPARSVFAVRETEAWILAAAASLASHGGLTESGTPSRAESIRDAKGALTKLMAPGQHYNAVADQPALLARIVHQGA